MVRIAALAPLREEPSPPAFSVSLKRLLLPDSTAPAASGPSASSLECNITVLVS